MDNDINWEVIRANIASNVLCALIETTKHAVLESPIDKKLYAKTAVEYADSLLEELRK